MTAVPAGIAGLDRIAQVKLPVTDLARSVSWYRRLLDLRLWTEFVEDGVLRGAGLIDPQGRFNIALRDRAACASQPSLDGFDVVAFLPASRSVLEDIAARCDRLDIAHSGIYETGGWAAPGRTRPRRHRRAFLLLHRPHRRVHRPGNARRPGGRDLPRPTAAITRPPRPAPARPRAWQETAAARRW